MSSSHAIQPVTNASPITTAETLIATITIPPEGQQALADGIALSGSVIGVAGAGTTSIQVRVRQGIGVTGTAVGFTFQNPVTASAAFVVGFDVVDPTTSYPVGNTYSITAQQVGATGNGTAFNAICTSVPCTPLPG